MSDNELLAQGHPPSRISRRLFLGGTLAVLSVPLINKMLLNPAYAAPVAGLPQAKNDFQTLSRYLTGHMQLDATLSERYYQAMLRLYPDFTAQVQALQTFISSRSLAASDLQKVLDAEQPALSKLPRTILQAWYIGVVGEGAQAICIAYEQALMNISVSDHLNPPSYAYGAYGTWARKPA
ncbi:MAG: sorbitol dehydrogenase family protein [Rouxiella aceris]|uniref:sorbitol dehydrogenase family protein n=1 Tax=Rouxiella aceris TaxID=2703884 RepID=UPI00283D5A38|nr:sorbitol dehydrogenase family protein [Rouxiella aceris]MDR3434919.1 sorbitol dehydrogenase family protein [Rouxiella aceris]